MGPVACVNNSHAENVQFDVYTTWQILKIYWECGNVQLGRVGCKFGVYTTWHILRIYWECAIRKSRSSCASPHRW